MQELLSLIKYYKPSGVVKVINNNRFYINFEAPDTTNEIVILAFY